MATTEGSQSKYQKCIWFCQINFHIVSYVKKLFIALVLVFLSGQPLAQIILILVVSVVSAAITLLTRPFAYRLLNAIRILTELLTILIVVLHLVFYIQAG